MSRFLLATLVLTLLVATVALSDVVLMWFSDGPDQDILRSMVRSFESVSKQKVQILTFPYYTEYKPKLTAMAQAGNPPDVARETDVLVWVDYAVDLSPLIPKYTGMTVEQWLDNVSVYKPMYREVVKRYKKVYGIPYTSDAHCIFYNADMFKKAGITPPTDRPWTVREWYDAMVKIKRSGVARYAVVYDASAYRFCNLLYTFGGGIWDREGKNLIIDSINSVKALDFFARIHKEDLVPRTVWLAGDAPAKYFQNGLAAMWVSGTWSIHQIHGQVKFDWGVIPWPVEKERVVMTGGKYLIPFTEKGAELAFFLTNAENLARFSAELYVLPDRRDLVGKVTFQDPKINRIYEIVVKDLNESGRGSMVWDWYYPDTAEVVQKNRVAIIDAIKAAIAGEKTPTKALQDLAKVLRDDLARMRRGK